GVEGADDVRVIELGRGAHLAFEELTGPLGVHEVRGENLQGDDAVHRLVLGLEDAAHDAAADAIENAILTERESVGSAAIDHLGLEARQQALIDQGASHGLAAVIFGRQLSRPGKFFRAEQPAVAQALEEDLAADLLRRHGESVRSSPNRGAGATNWMSRILHWFR